MTLRHRLFALTLAAALAVVPAACGGSSDDDGDATPTTEAAAGVGAEPGSDADPQTAPPASADEPAFGVGLDVAASAMARALNAVDHQADEDARTVGLRFDEGSEGDGSLTCLSIVGLVDPDVTITLTYPDGVHTCER